MKTSTFQFSNFTFDTLPSEKSVSIKTYSKYDLRFQIPAIITIQQCNNLANVYINEFGCIFLNHGSSELLDMGQKYFSNFFPPEEIEIIQNRHENLIKKNRVDKCFSFFQRIRPHEKLAYSWFFTTSQLSLSLPKKELYLLNISLPIGECRYMEKNLDSLVRENLFLHKNQFAPNPLKINYRQKKPCMAFHGLLHIKHKTCAPGYVQEYEGL